MRYYRYAQKTVTKSQAQKRAESKITNIPIARVMQIPILNNAIPWNVCDLNTNAVESSQRYICFSLSLAARLPVSFILMRWVNRSVEYRLYASEVNFKKEPVWFIEWECMLVCGWSRWVCVLCKSFASPIKTKWNMWAWSTVQECVSER